ncbi:RPM1 interacting protein 13-like [Lycium ferocissimum]|uniref:RPM1 interacting protein 13-like n=1 Tax=Lycium ferocissimum TaxID=112874 RepID=UPI00281551D9|nr:RPM1 interacting protein 13-like [Lycium ferocissimum]
MAKKVGRSECVTPLIIDLASSSSSDEGSPLRPIFCLKKREQLKEFEEKEECFILDFDPYDSVDISKLSFCENDDAPDISVVSEKGQVACRDFPHPRHACAKYPFEKTAHQTHCEMCYCFVCDVAAPCTSWTGASAHCHAMNNEAWKTLRNKLLKN